MNRTATTCSAASGYTGLLEGKISEDLLKGNVSPCLLICSSTSELQSVSRTMNGGEQILSSNKKKDKVKNNKKTQPWRASVETLSRERGKEPTFSGTEEKKKSQSFQRDYEHCWTSSKWVLLCSRMSVYFSEKCLRNYRMAQRIRKTRTCHQCGWRCE